MGGAEDAIWLLGHFDEHALFYANLAKHTVANALPNPQLLGTKDNLYRLLDRLRDAVGDRATKFLPRTWLPDDIARERALSKSDRLGGLWLRKDPGQELGAGIKLITRWSELEGCANCILQRYVDRPFPLNDAAAGVVGAKARLPSDRQTLAQGLFSAAFNGGAGVGAALGGLGVRRIGYRNTFLVFTAGFVVATVAAFVKLVDDSPPEDERRWKRPRDEFEEDGDLV